MLTIICANCQGKIGIHSTDKLAVCPNCEVNYFILTGQAEVTSEIVPDGITYLLTIEGQEISFTTDKQMRLTSNSLLTVIIVQGQPLAIADHQRKLWFPVPQQRDYKISLLRGLLMLVTAVLTVLWWQKLLESFSLIIGLAFAITIILIAIPTIVTLRQRKTTIPESLRIEFS